MSSMFERIRQARERIAPYIVETPLLRLPGLDPFLGCQVYVKAECMQITGAFKLRGAMNKMLALDREQLSRGVTASSSGNHGRAVSYAAKLLGTRATIIMPDTAPAVKLDAIRALGAQIVQCPAQDRHAMAGRICEEQGSVLVPPFNDEAIMAGQGTAGMEIMEQCPELDMVIVPVSGGGLLSGVAAAVKEMSPGTRVWGAEPAPLPRYGASLAQGEPVTVPQQSTVADALIGNRPGDKCFPVVQAYADGVAAVEDRSTLRAMKLLLTQGKLLAEPSSCIGMGAVLQGTIAPSPGDKVCFLLSGGNVGLEQLRCLEDIEM